MKKKSKEKPTKKKKSIIKEAPPQVEAPIVVATPVVKEPRPPIDAKKMEMIRDKMVMMRYKDLQIACVTRGIDFDFMVAQDINGLQTWLTFNWDVPCIQERLSQFDEYREKKLEEIGRKGEPFVRLGIVGELDDYGNIKELKKPEKLLSKPKKRERDEDTGIFKGTKKALTLELNKQGLPFDQIVIQVKEKFPEANDKSIKIWIKRFNKANEKKKK